MRLDSGTEVLGARLPLIFLFGLALMPWDGALSTTVQKVAITPGVAVIEDHAQQFSGRELDCAQGDTLAASSEFIVDVVFYWNPNVAKMYVLGVQGAVALTSAGAVAPTDAAIEAAIGDSTWPWTSAGKVKFARDSGTVVTLTWIDRVSTRDYNIDPDIKDGTTASAQEKDVVGTNRQLYVFSHRERLSVDAANIADGDVLTNKPVPAFYGKIGAWRYVVEKAITTAAKTTTPNLEINTTNVTGSDGTAIAGTKALGVTAELGVPTAANTFKPGDTWSIEAASTTAFAEGRIAFEVDFYRLVA